MLAADRSAAAAVYRGAGAGASKPGASGYQSDEVEAEVMRLEALGATRIRQLNTAWLIQAPTGRRLGVVRSKGATDFQQHAMRWPYPATQFPIRVYS
jgi:hypothetical protein